MEDYLKSRPIKKAFSKELQLELRAEAVSKIISLLLPDDKIVQINLIGSSVKETFGEYEHPGFRGSLFSDFDFIVLVDDDYEIPDWLELEPDGKPFSNEELNLAYRNKKFIRNKYDVELFFLKNSSLSDPAIVLEAESAGIPTSKKSVHKHLSVYDCK